ncbi:MAG: major capsid protein [Spirochaetales bacterium]|nr:major capsid protein [Spirochaetales bacterium]
MTIFDLFTPELIAAYWTEAASNRIPYLGEGLFPNAKKVGLDLSWIHGNEGLPVSLMPSAFDAKATFRDRPGIEKTETEMPFFREGFKLKEKDRQELLKLQEVSNPYVSAVVRHYLDDARRLLEGAAVVRERMRMALLFPTGVTPKPGFSFNANGVSYVYDYDPNSSWATNHYIALTSTAKWDAPSTADPFANIQTMQDQVRAETGEEVRTMIMNSVTFNLLMKCDNIKNRFLTTNGLAVGYITKQDVVRVIQDVTGMRIAVYDKQYKNESGTAAKFVPDNYVAFVPDGALGNTWFGTTPEEADLLGNGDHDVSIVDTGVALLRTTEEHPVGLNIFASQIVMPSYERMAAVGLMKVA